MFIKAPFQCLPFIKEIWYWTGVEAESLPWILPSYEIEMVYHLQSPPLVFRNDTNLVTLPKLHWVGPQNLRWKIHSKEKLNLISVRFHAGALWELMGQPINEMVNHFPDIEETSNSHFLQLKKFLSGINLSQANQIQTFESYLAEIIQQYKQKLYPIDTNIRFAFSELTDSNAKISEIEKKTGISRKQIERGMKKVYGFAPGEIRKIHRILKMIRNPIHYKSERIETRLTDIAYDYGYVDQSHLIHDFKLITGYLPKEWFKNYKKMSYFYNSNV
jgi:AraC-like DNA-binding protein